MIVVFYGVGYGDGGPPPLKGWTKTMVAGERGRTDLQVKGSWGKKGKLKKDAAMTVEIVRHVAGIDVTSGPGKRPVVFGLGESDGLLRSTIFQTLF